MAELVTAGYYDTSYPPSLWVPPATPATVVSVAPSSLVASSGATTVTVTGTGFTASSTIRLDAVDAATTLVSPTQVTASFDPAGAARTVTVTVAGASGFAAITVTAGAAAEPEPEPAPEPDATDYAG